MPLIDRRSHFQCESSTLKCFFVLYISIIGGSLLSSCQTQQQSRLEHNYVNNEGVKLHYAAQGQGDLVVFIHGFPDFWYSFNHQMNHLKNHYRVVALDTRGYNLSDKPKEQADYDMKHLVADVIAVIKAEKRNKAVIVGHDWGGAIAWQLTLSQPEWVDKLIIVNLPHPKGMMRELTHNPTQKANSQYARAFQNPLSHKLLNADFLARLVAKDADTLKRYKEALERSSFEGMMNYYRQNYPKEPYQEITGELPKVNIPVLQFHGLKDKALHHHGLNNTWEWLGKDYTLVTLPEADHWAHHDEADLVSETMLNWLQMRTSK